MNGTEYAQDVESDDICGIMRTENGRRIITRILKYSGVFVDNFNADPYENAKNTGRRQVGLWLQRELERAAPEEYITLLKERLFNE